MKIAYITYRRAVDSMRVRSTLAVIAASFACVACAASSVFASTELPAKSFRWSSRSDVFSMDPHSTNNGFNNTISSYVYEPLVIRGKTMAIEGALAVSWLPVDATTMRFKLRDKVKFHDGAAFSADDVVFSITRALEKTSDFSEYMQGIRGAKKIDALTVDIVSDVQNPTLLDQLTEIRIMNKAWAQNHKVLRPQDYKNGEETYTARNANGTGPFILKSREPDVKTVMIVNPNWWSKIDGAITEVIYRPIKSDATRVAALITGELDLVLDPPVQDLAKLKENRDIKILEGNENRTIFLNFDQSREELLYGSKGKNPFKDIRVRQAMLLAIDVNAIHKTVMRGLSLPTMSMIAPQVRGYTKDVEKRPAVDLVRAKKLMAEAGLANGFEVTFDCPNDRYINDIQICSAIAAMLAKIDIRVRLNAMPATLFLPKIQKSDTSLYLLGWGVPTFDSLNPLQALLRTKTKGTDGNFNFSGYSNAKVDALVEKLKTETDFKKRADLTREALLIDQADVGHIPLHHQVIPWAMRKNVTVVHRSDNGMWARWAVIN